MWQVVRNGVWGMKMPFKFTEYKPSLDWFDTIHHEISEDDYTYFKLDRRYGHSWWLYGMKFDEKDFRWEEKEIGQIGEGDLRRFIEWAKFEEEKGGGSRIINIHMISGSFDIYTQIFCISVTQKKCVEWLYQEDRQDESSDSERCEIWHMFKRHTTEIAHTPNHV